MSDEMQLHVELQTEQNIAAGMKPEEARYAALREFGNVASIQEQAREARGWTWLHQLGQDIFYSLRLLRQSPGYTTVAVLTLALGIGVTTTTFSYLRATLFQPLPFDRPEGLVQLLGTQAPADLLDIKEQSGVFSKFAIIDFPDYSVTLPGQPAERVSAFTVGGDFFSMMGIPPLHGRLFGTDEDQLGRNQVVVLSYHYWMRRFHGDPAVVGRSLRFDGEPVEVIGILPERFDVSLIWGARDLWRPLAMVSDIKGVRVNTWLRVAARLKPGVSLADAQAKLDTIAVRQQREFSVTNANRWLVLAKLGAVAPGREQLLYGMVMALAISVLLIACGNLANLQLARGLHRSREYAVRAALGASRRRLLSQTLTESLMLSLLGGAFGGMAAWAACPMLSVRVAEVIDSPGFRLSTDFGVLGFALIASTVTGVIFGIVPAWLASRIDVNMCLKQAGPRAIGNKSRHRLRQCLIVAELSLTLVLLSGAGYFLHGFRKLATRELGWRPDHLLTGRIILPYNRYGNFDQCLAFYNRLNAELAAIPGIVSSAVCDSLPIDGFVNAYAVIAVGVPPPADGNEVRAYFNPVGVDYFATLGMKIQQGRNFTTADRHSSSEVIVINRALAEQLWPNENPIGKHINSPLAADRWKLEVVGIVNDVGFSVNPYPRTRYQIYFPIAQTGGNYLFVAARTSVAPESLGDALRLAVSRIDPDLAVSRVASSGQISAQSGSRDSLFTNSLIFIATSGLLLSALGLYGVIANLVTERTSEIGLRIALGAQLGNVVWLVLRQGVRLASIGVCIGLVGAWMLARILGTRMPGVIEQDPLVLAGCSFLLFSVTLLACWLPVRRAAKVDPMVALRAD